MLTPSTVAVADDLLIRLNLKVGDSVKLGNALFRIVATVENEPDRLTGTFAAGPRVLLSQQALERPASLGFGSRASRRYLFKMPLSKPGQASSDAAVAAMKARLEALLPEAQVTDYREANPAPDDGPRQRDSLLSLMSLIALVLGAVGVAMAMRAHLQQRLDTIAIMKSLGAQLRPGDEDLRDADAAAWACRRTARRAAGLRRAACRSRCFWRSCCTSRPASAWIMSSIAVGIGAGLFTTLLFTLPPLLDIRGVRPILILRRAVEDSRRSVRRAPDEETARQPGADWRRSSSSSSASFFLRRAFPARRRSAFRSRSFLLSFCLSCLACRR